MSWGAHLGWLQLAGSPLAFMATTAAVAITSVMAVGEYFADQWPRTPSRVSPGPLIGRLVTGGLSGACLFVSAGHSLVGGVACGAAGAVIGAVTGYHVRGWLVQERKVKDLRVGLAEDVLCLGLSYWIVSVR